mmetsp:Transcript_123085/g.184092  ORF Transcript_123085/g.184092 Transcript_123085/m.184092 type:complete len:134 (+) Transcript_123085:462-863(+)
MALSSLRQLLKFSSNSTENSELELEEEEGNEVELEEDAELNSHGSTSEDDDHDADGQDDDDEEAARLGGRMPGGSGGEMTSFCRREAVESFSSPAAQIEAISLKASTSRALLVSFHCWRQVLSCFKVCDKPMT